MGLKNIISVVFFVFFVNSLNAQIFKRQNKISTDTVEIIFKQKAIKLGVINGGWYDGHDLWALYLRDKYQDEVFKLDFTFGVISPLFFEVPFRSPYDPGSNFTYNIDGQFCKGKHYANLTWMGSHTIVNSLLVNYSFFFGEFEFNRKREMSLYTVTGMHSPIRDIPTTQEMGFGVSGGTRTFFYSSLHPFGKDETYPELSVKFRFRHDSHIIFYHRSQGKDNGGYNIDDIRLYPDKVTRHDGQFELKFSAYPNHSFDGYFGFDARVKYSSFPLYKVQKGYSNRKFILEAGATKISTIDVVLFQAMIGMGF